MAEKNPRKMLSKRRGQDVMSSQTASILIILLSVIIIILIAANLKNIIEGQSGFESCKNSIAIAHDNYGRPAAGKGRFNLDCPANHVLITKDDIDENSAQTVDEQVNDIIAGEMVRCWRMVGKGVFNPYGQLQIDNSFCLLCSVITFDKQFRWEWPEITGLYKHLEETSESIDDVETTYAKFLPDGWNDPERVDDTIDATQAYVVFWWEDRILANAPLGKPSYVGFKPSNNVIEDRCEYIVN